jgi:hypothetical protein
MLCIGSSRAQHAQGYEDVAALARQIASKPTL